MHIEITKKKYSERLNAHSKLKTCGEPVPKILIGNLLEKNRVNPLIVFDKEWEEEWRGKTLRDYCFYVARLRKSGDLDSLQKNSCDNLAGILKEKMKTMKGELMEIEKNEKRFGINSKELYHQIIQLLRAIECLEMKKDKPFTKIERLAPAIPADSANFSPREAGQPEP